MLGILVACCISCCSSLIIAPSAAEQEARPTIELKPPKPTPRAAICYSGGFRTFMRSVRMHKQRVIDPWPAADVFMFVELDDTFSNPGKRGNHSKEFAEVRAMLNPVQWQTYTQADAHAHQRGIQCFSQPTLSHQMWAIKESFDMAMRHETAAEVKYTWFVRARPDTRPGSYLPVKAVFSKHTAPGEKVAWRRRYSGGSDCLAVMTRAAATSLSRAHEHLFLPASTGECGYGAAGAAGKALGRICGPSWKGKYPTHFGMAPVCYMWLAWASDNVTILFDPRVSAEPIRPWAHKPHKHQR